MHVFSGEIPFGHVVHSFAVAENTPAISLTGTTLRTGHLYCYLYDSRQQLRASVMLQKPEKVLTVCSDWASPLARWPETCLRESGSCTFITSSAKAVRRSR